MTTMSEQSHPIADEELLLRRIPAANNWFDPAISTKPDPNAFKPHRENDGSGLSMSRAQSSLHPEFLTAERLALTGPSNKGYFVAVLLASDLRARGLDFEPDPLPGDPGHTLLPRLNSANRDDDETLEWMRVLALELTIQVEGPFLRQSTRP
jgi:hypothetical protein